MSEVLNLTAEEVVRANMREYGMYTIEDRAIPRVEDGLKPVQRRILYAMQQLGLKPGAGTHKCSRIVGDAMGKLHPHGDAGIQGALVSMAQWWSKRYPLVQPQGNFGSVMGDGPSAMRYIEAGFTDIGYDLFYDAKYLDMTPTYDGRGQEPVALSSLAPTLLVNGYSGVATGCSGSIPSHDIVEILQAALDNLKGLEFQVRGPQLPNKCFLTSSQKDIQQLYATGRGTLYYTSSYQLHKDHSVLIDGFAPGVTYDGLWKSLKDLIDKDLVSIEDETEIQLALRIRMKDSRLLESRILPAISGSDSYQFHAINSDGNLQLFSLKQILDAWQNFRLMLWDRRISDMSSQLQRQIREVQTQLAIASNLDRWAEAIKLPTIEQVKVAVTKFIEPEMFDYALDLPNRRILKLNETSLKDKLAELHDKLKRWTDTTAAIELEKQLVELIEYYRDHNVPYTVQQVKWDDLPRFEKTIATTQWMILNDVDHSLSMDAPTRGRGFASRLIGKCDDLFTIISRSGWMEQYSIFSLPKRFGYQEWQSTPLAFVPHCDGIYVGLDPTGSMHAQVIRKFNKTYQSLSKDGIRLQRALYMTANDSLIIRYKDGRFARLSYDKVMARTTTRGTSGVREYWGPNNPAVDIHLAYKDGFIYTPQGVQDTSKLKKLTDLTLFDVGEENFVVLKTGQRQILNRKQAKEILTDIEQLHRLRG